MTVMEAKANIGNIDNIVATLKASGFRVVKNGYGDKSLMVGNDSKVQAMFDECRRKQDEHGLRGAFRSNLLCDYQVKAHRQGYLPMALGSNIYGWAVGSTLHSNLSGGRWALTPRGYSLEEAIAYGCRKATSGKNVTFRIGLDDLPEDARAQLV